MFKKIFREFFLSPVIKKSVKIAGEGRDYLLVILHPAQYLPRKTVADKVRAFFYKAWVV